MSASNGGSAMIGGTRVPTFPVVLAGFAAFLDLYATQPLLPLLARTFNASAFEVGLTITAPTVAVALAAPAVGRLADRIGLRRTILLSATALAVTTALAATATSLRQVILWRFMQGVATPGIFASAIAYVHEVWPASRAGRGTAAYMSGTVLGGFIGRAVAGIVAADATWHESFIALALLNGAVAVALWFLLPPERRERAVVVRPPAHPLQLLRNRRLVATFGVGFCVLFTQVAMFTYVTFLLAAPPFNLSTVALGWLFVVYLVGAVVTPLSGAWVDRYGHRAGLGSAMSIGAVGALLTLMPWLPAIIAGLALCATGVFIAQATTSGYIGTVTTQDRALAVGMYSTFYYAGGSTGGALPAAFWARGGWPACVVLVMFVQAIGAAIAFTQWTGSSEHASTAIPETGV
ncbi:MAG TPA: MFS transporter [Vicinamibacterales bacterium]|jgi:MFS family permease